MSQGLAHDLDADGRSSRCAEITHQLKHEDVAAVAVESLERWVLPGQSTQT